MSPNVRKWLLIGGGSVAGLLLVLCLVFFLLIRPISYGVTGAAGGGGALPMAPEEAARQDVDGSVSNFAPSAGEVFPAGAPPAVDSVAQPEFAAQPTQGAGGGTGGGD